MEPDVTIRDVLANMEVFAGCTGEALDELAGLAREGRLQEGEVLFEEGDPTTAVFVITAGAIRISRAVLVNTNRTLAVLPAGTFFGEAGLIGESGRSGRSATASAVTECELVALPHEAMRAWLTHHPAAGVKVLERLGQQMLARLRATNELLKETVVWGLEVSGASLLSLDRLITQRATLRVALASGRTVSGRLVRVDRDEGDAKLWLVDLDGQVHLVPYHGVEDLVADVDLEALHRSASTGEREA
jgi:CRP-like cAMP-binding protein